MLGVIRMILVGLVVGALARFFYPGAIHMSILLTILLGIAGSFLAGLVGYLLHRRTGEGFHPAGFLWSLIGAIVIIFIGIHFGHYG